MKRKVQTRPENIWAADHFWKKVAEEVIKAGGQDLNVHKTVLAATLEHVIPAGTA